MNFPHWARLNPDLQDALLDELAKFAPKPVVEDSASLANEQHRLQLAERFGRYRTVAEFAVAVKSSRKEVV